MLPPMAGPSLEGLLNPAMLGWARNQSQLSLEAAAEKVKQKPERLAEWERGERFPTLNQLRALGGIYRCSVGLFFLNEAPREAKRPVDYRRFEVSMAGTLSPALANGIREAEAKREAALDIYAQLEQDPPAWDLFIDPDVPPEDAANQLLNRLRVSMRGRRGWATHYEALSGWRAAVESLGVLVVQLSGVEMQEMRGCCLALYPLPVILLNSTDLPLGRVFTLLHELTHLARRESGLCDLQEDAPRAERADAVEVYCNHVAGAVLLPAADLLARPEVAQAGPETEWSDGQLASLRRHFWGSREAVLRRLLILDRTSRQFYQVMRERFELDYAAQRAQPPQHVVVPYYRRVLLSNGQFLTRLAVNAYASSVITGSTLSRVLNTKLDHLPDIRQALAGEVVT